MIVKDKKGYKVVSKSGKTLGKHKSKSEARKQLAAIEISKAKKKK